MGFDNEIRRDLNWRNFSEARRRRGCDTGRRSCDVIPALQDHSSRVPLVPAPLCKRTTAGARVAADSRFRCSEVGSCDFRYHSLKQPIRLKDKSNNKLKNNNRNRSMKPRLQSLSCYKIFFDKRAARGISFINHEPNLSARICRYLSHERKVDSKYL